ncbi:MAG: hypothetical protein A2Z14_10065 [Chloroflexi bacterium RBG_16_48_8]|nr:MAG: hypothetical protein A2Z14_10065 [Chloroflexi bacterium RBG_16_48_8]
MAKPNLILTLAKVIIAAAWADGMVSHEEVNCLKDLLFRIPDLNARDWASLEIYIDSPIGPDERERLLEGLQMALRSRSDKQLALSALDDLIHVEGEITQEEVEVSEEIKAAIQSAGVGILGGMSKLMSGPILRRSQAIAGAPNREVFLDDFMKNSVFYGVRRHLNESDIQLDLPEEDLWKLSLAGGLMARVAHVDREVNEGEFDNMLDSLQRNWGLPKEAAAIVAEVAISAVAANMDYYRMAREFFSCTTEQERFRFLDMLFAVADGDGMVSYEETEQIRSIARHLKLTHKQFIDAKLKIPRNRRSS